MNRSEFFWGAGSLLTGMIYSGKQKLFSGASSFLNENSLKSKSIQKLGTTDLFWPEPLKEGSRVGIVAPASRITDPDVFKQIKKSMDELGLIPDFGPSVNAAYGYLSGTDQERANDLNEYFRNPDIDGIFALRGGWGSSRILPLLDFEAISANPKFFCGYSDITSLHLAIHAKTGLVTFHGPNSNTEYTEWTKEHFVDVAFAKKSRYELRPAPEMESFTIREGKASGRFFGGNLTVLTSLIGTQYLPDLAGSILFLEDIDEDVYRVDRMLSQLALSGILSQVSGVVFGKCMLCDESKPNTLTLRQVLEDHLLPLEIPAFYGTMISHEKDIFTVPVGWPVNIDASGFTIEFERS